MKILPNIIPLIKIKNSLKFPDKYKADIEKYRREGNAEKEREFILKASSVWGKKDVYKRQVLYTSTSPALPFFLQLVIANFYTIISETFCFVNIAASSRQEAAAKYLRFVF